MPYLRLLAVCSIALPSFVAQADAAPHDRCVIGGEEITAGLERADGLALPEAQAQPQRRHFEDTPGIRTIGEVVVADVVACAGAGAPPECAFVQKGTMAGRKVFEYRNYGRELLAKVSGVVGDHVEVPIFFTDFITSEFPGAFYATFFNDIMGTGLKAVDNRRLMGKDPSSSALHGLIAMNLWWNCGIGDTYAGLDTCQDHPPFSTTYVTIHGILLHEVGHRWGNGLKFRDAGNGDISSELLGRAGSHWSYWLNTDASPLEGNQWVDDGGGRFRVTIPEITQYSDLDLYVMGLLEPSEVAPSFFIRPDGCPGGGHCSTARKPAPRETSATGTRIDVTIDQILAAMGTRHPTVDEAPKVVRVAFVLTRLETGPHSESFGADDEAAAKLERVRRDWSGFFYDATRTRARVISTLSGRDDYPRWEFTASAEGWAAFGAKEAARSVDGAVVLESAAGAEVALVHEEVQLEAAEYASASIRVAVPASAAGSKLRLSFGGLEGFVGGRHLELPLIADGALHDYVFDLRRASSWKGTVGMIRVALAGAPAGTAFTIDRLAFSDEIVEGGSGAGDRGGEGGGGCSAVPGSVALGLLAVMLLGRRAARR